MDNGQCLVMSSESLTACLLIIPSKHGTTDCVHTPINLEYISQHRPLFTVSKQLLKLKNVQQSSAALLESHAQYTRSLLSISEQLHWTKQEFSVLLKCWTRR